MMLDKPAGNGTSYTFLDSLERADHRTDPYDHWLLETALPDSVCDAIAALPVDPPGGMVFDGRRESNNSSRLFFNPEAQQAHAVCAEVAAAFSEPRVIHALEKACSIDLSKGSLRIEYCQDVDGFWLEPHTDISVKLFTMLVYLSDDPKLTDAGTDIYDGDHNWVGRSPYGKGLGLIFIPGDDTWHGVARRPIRGIRKSIIVNFVREDWRAREELA